MTKCRKCDTLGTIVLRKKDYYCEGCFLNITNHKFRASIGKNKILSTNENVLICLSGGLGSTVLLDLIHNGLSQDAHKKLRVTPFFLHLTGFDMYEDNNKKVANYILKQCEHYGFQVHIVLISDYMLSHSNLHETNIIPSMNNDAMDKFHNMLHNIPATARNDFITKIKRDMFIRCARSLDCKFVFTAETTKTLAINLLTNIAIGRGSQIENDIGFSDQRDEIKILKPMREITKEELDCYVKIKKIESIHLHDVEDNSLQSVIKSFVTDLQDNYQATISTVCKTADKIGKQEYDGRSSGNCVLCKSDFERKICKLSALEATNYSRTISLTPPQAIEVQQLTGTNTLNSSMFPLIHKSLCYSCSRNYSEMRQCELPKHIQEFLKVL